MNKLFFFFFFIFLLFSDKKENSKVKTLTKASPAKKILAKSIKLNDKKKLDKIKKIVEDAFFLKDHTNGTLGYSLVKKKKKKSNIKIYFKNEKKKVNLFIQTSTFVKNSLGNLTEKGFSLLFSRNKGWYQFRSTQKVKPLDSEKKLHLLLKEIIGDSVFLIKDFKEIDKKYVLILEEIKSNNKETWYSISFQERKGTKKIKLFINKLKSRYERIEFSENNILKKIIFFSYKKNQKNNLFYRLREKNNLTGKFTYTLKNTGFDTNKIIPSEYFKLSHFKNIYGTNKNKSLKKSR